MADPTAIVVAYNGSTHPAASQAYDKLEAQIRAQYPDAALRRVFLSEKILEKVNDDQVDSLAGALEKLAVEKHQHVAILPGMVFAGETYVMMMATLMVFGEVFADGVSLFRPLMDWELDCKSFASTILEELSSELENHDTLVFLAHSPHPTIEMFEKAVKEKFDKVIITTLKDQDIELSSGSKALVIPLMVCGGNHVNHDMKKLVSKLRADGIECTPIYKGLCEYDSICELLTSHIIPG